DNNNDDDDDDIDNHSDDSEIEIEQPQNREDIRTFALEKGYIKSNITKLGIMLENPIYSDIILGDFIPDSVTHLEIPVLHASLCPLIPKSVRSLKLKSQIPVYDGAFRMIPPHITDLSVIMVGDWSLPFHEISPTVQNITINKLYPFANLTSISHLENSFDIDLHYNMDEVHSIISSIRSNTTNLVIQELLKKDDVFVKCEGSGPIPQTTKHLIRLCRDTDPLPFGITQMICSQDRAIPPGELPESLTKIDFIYLNQCLSNVHLPQSLKYLIIPNMDQLIYRNTHIPKSVTHFGINLHGSNHEGIVTNSWLFKKGYLPESVRFIKIDIFNLKPNQISDIILPSSILYFDLQVDELYADKLELFYKKIKFIDAQEYYHNAPEFVQTTTLETGNISKIDFGKHFNQLIKPGQLSSNITDLTFGQSYLQSIGEGVIPSSVDKLTLECKENIGAVSIPFPISSLSLPAILLPDNPLADKTSIKDLSIDGKLNRVERIGHLDDDDDDEFIDHDQDELDQTPTIPILIEQLPFSSLEKLCLKNVKNIGSESMTDYSFPHLQELKIDTIYADTQRIYVDFLSKVIVNLKSLFLYGNFKSHLKNIDFPSTKLESLDANEFFYINPNQIPLSMKNLSIPINEKNFNLIQSKNFVHPKIKNDNQDFLKKRFQLQDMMAHSLIFHDYRSKKVDIVTDGSRFKNLSIFTDTAIKGLDKIPSNVIAWYFGNRAQTLPPIIPKTLKKTSCGYYPTIQIPSWITHLTLFYGDGKNVKKGYLPESITYLELNTIFDASGSIDDDDSQDDESIDDHNDFDNDDMRESQLVGVLSDKANSDDEDHDDGGEQLDHLDDEDEDEEQNDEIEAYYLTLKEALPSKLKVLNIFNLKFGVCNIIPPTVEILQIRDHRFKLVDKSFKNLPSTIKKIKIPKNCFQENVKKIPSFLATRLDGNYQVYEKNVPIGKKTTHLIINGPLVIKKGLIPDNVNTIILGHYFNQPIPHLPSSITEINFGYNFNQDLSTVSFPPNLKYLSFGDSFDKPLDSLPTGLKFLNFKVLNPHSAQSLVSIPDSVDHLSIKYACLDLDSDDDEDEMSDDIYLPPSNPLLVIPDCIKFLKLGVSIVNVKLPPNLKSITCLHSCLGEKKLKTSEKKVRETIDTTLSLENIDPSIKLNINTSGSFDRLINPNSLIDNIKSISFGTKFNQVLPKNSLPPSVEFLKFGFYYDQQFQIGSISSCVTQLELGAEYDKSLRGILPNGLKKLIIKSGFYHKDMLDWLPKSLEYLELGNDETMPNQQPFPIEKLPPNITTLILNDSVLISSPSKIPKTIKHLKLCKCKTWDYLPIDSLESLTLGEYNYPLNMIFKSK
ncbi:hypothetical protein CYY_010232, partial [Polysphondylium violaceum]